MKKLIMILGTVSIAMSAIFVRMSSAPSIVLVFYRMLFAVLILIPMLVIKFREEIKRLKMRDILWCACGGLFLGLHFTVFFESLKYTSIAASVVLVNMEAFIVSITLVLWCGEKIPRKGILGIAAVFLGTVLIAVSDMGNGSNVVFGDALALLGAFFASAYTLIGRSCRTHISTSVYTCFVYGFACLTVCIGMLVSGTSFTGYAVMDYGAAFGMTIFCTFFGHSVYSWGLKYLSASYISTVKLMESFFSALFGFFIFGEVPAALVILGGVIAIGGVAAYSQVDTARGVDASGNVDTARGVDTSENVDTAKSMNAAKGLKQK